MAYQFNPPGLLFQEPQFSDFSMPDPEAGPKPSWDNIVEAWERSQPINLRAEKLRGLDEEATARIARLYHPLANQYPNKEWQVRLSGIDLTVQDTERVRLIMVYDDLAARLTAATTLAELEAIDVTDDAIWAPS